LGTGRFSCRRDSASRGAYDHHIKIFPRPSYFAPAVKVERVVKATWCVVGGHEGMVMARVIYWRASRFICSFFLHLPTPTGPFLNHLLLKPPPCEACSLNMGDRLTTATSLRMIWTKGSAGKNQSQQHCVTYRTPTPLCKTSQESTSITILNEFSRIRHSSSPFSQISTVSL
jgi:hypothetical protein